MMNLIYLHNSIHNRGHLNVCNRRNSKWRSFGDKMEGFSGEGGILPSLRLPYSWYVTQWWPHGRKTYACSCRRRWVYISLAYFTVRLCGIHQDLSQTSKWKYAMPVTRYVELTGFTQTSQHQYRSVTLDPGAR